jgi:enoyl-CoA hydratase
MPLPDSPFRISTDDAVATLWLDCDTLAPARVRQLADLAEAVAARPAVEVLVIRSGYPGGLPSFDRRALRDLDSDEAAADYARAGQLALRRLANLPIPTVAFLEGPCAGPALELALACDYRLAVATPDAILGLGDLPTTWGGRSRLATRIGRRTASRFVSCYPREGAKLGLVDDAFCQRRAKIELRRFLDRLQLRPVKRGVPTDVIAEATERRAFRAAVRDGLAIPQSTPVFDPSNPIPARPRRVGVIGSGATAMRWACEFALRGVPVTWLRTTTADPFAVAVSSGRVTPLEADQATARTAVVTRLDDALTADLVVIDETDDTGAAFLERVMPARSVLLLPGAHLDGVLPSCTRPTRVLGWESAGGRFGLVTHPDTADDAAAAAARWLRLAGETVDVQGSVAVPEPASQRRSLSLMRPEYG